MNIEYRMFYAETDTESMVIRNIIVQNNLMRLFNFTDVLTLNMDELQNLQMKKVPTIVVSDRTTNAAQIYDGPQKCAMFVNNLIMNRRSAQINEAKERMKSIQKAQKDIRIKNDGPAEYSEAEMSGISDSYAYTQTDMAQAKAFVIVGQEDTLSVITPQIKESKITPQQLKASIHDLKNQRDQDINTFKQNMERRQIDAVINR